MFLLFINLCIYLFICICIYFIYLFIFKYIYLFIFIFYLCIIIIILIISLLFIIIMYSIYIICICIYICMYVYIYICIYVCTYLRMSVCVFHGSCHWALTFQHVPSNYARPCRHSKTKSFFPALSHGSGSKPLRPGIKPPDYQPTISLHRHLQPSFTSFLIVFTCF